MTPRAGVGLRSFRKDRWSAMSVLGAASILAAMLSFAMLPLGQNAAAQAEGINITFEFVPAKAAYAQGEAFSVNITAVNTLVSGGYNFDSLAYKEKVINVSAHFAWMAPNEFAFLNVSGTSTWLAPDGAGIETFSLPVTIPVDAIEQTYSYFFRVEFLSHTPWGNTTNVWGTDLTYHDFTVGTVGTGEPDGNISPYVLGTALGLAIASIALGMVIYWRGVRRSTSAPIMPADGAGAAPAAAAAGGTTYPIIKAAPGERFPIEKGFIYLVKEKRPNISFAMFNEAIAHGAQGMLVVREHPNRLKQLYKFEAAKILWLTRRVGVDHIDPTELSLLNLDITKFVQGMPKTVVLLEGLEYIITQNDFETVLRFVNHLHDFVLAHDCAVIIAIDPRVLSTRELALMERSARIVEPVEGMEQRAPEPPAQVAA